jgi:hypothetical protein
MRRRYRKHGTPALADRPRSGHPRMGSPRLGQRILWPLQQPKAWTIGLWQRLGPHRLGADPHRRVREVAC